MAETKIFGYKKMFGLVLPDWVDERLIRLSAGGLLAVAVMFLVLIFVVWPNMSLIETKKAELGSATNALRALENSKQGLDRVQSELTNQELSNVLLAIPQQYSPENAIYLLRKISNDSGVSITGYSLPSGVLLDSATPGVGGRATTGEMVEFSTFPVRITVAAPVDSLLNFISKVESSLPYGVVSDLNLQEITKLSKSVAGKSVQLGLEIKFFQSNLKSVNINKVSPFTEADIALAKDLVKYNILTEQGLSEAPIGTASAGGTGSVFGF